MKCLMCSKRSFIRGLCPFHFTEASKLVAANKTSWNKLIRIGRALKYEFIIRKGTIVRHGCKQLKFNPGLKG